MSQDYHRTGAQMDAETFQNEIATFLPWHNNLIVIAKVENGELTPKSYGNRKAAYAKADAMGPEWAVYKSGPRFFVGLIESMKE